jgi:hypothetical protein
MKLVKRSMGNPHRIQQTHKKKPHNDQRARLGENQVECMRCGMWFRNVDCLKEWTGLIVCTCCWEPRQPQDFVHDILEDFTPNLINPSSLIIASDGTFTTVPGLATAGTILPNTGQTMYLPETGGVYRQSGKTGG